ncbi:MAG: family ATPase, partial [Solirubrobacterales bacterium]|nr:family ATPase [Solirubrobacterales bacterium]
MLRAGRGRRCRTYPQLRMPDSFSQDRIEHLLEGLNPPQREAVVHGEGPLLILAGAGSGKTRVLTHRVAHLIHTRQARAGEILAITFTNKAAQEMRERVELLLGHSTRAMWVMTFHAACARILRAEAVRLGYTRQFTIYDQSDSRRLVKKCLDDLGVDTKRFTPGAVHHQISDAKNKLRDAEAYRQLVGGFFEQTVADAFALYEREMHRMNAMDFDDLLVRTVNVLELFPEVRARYQATFRHVLVDEYQDTNHVQYRMLQLLAGGGKEGGHRNLAVVGDDAQCLVEGTLVTMGDGTMRPIEDVLEGDEVLSCVGPGAFAPARVTRTFRATDRTTGIAVSTRAGRHVVSTEEHLHFADARRGASVGSPPMLGGDPTLGDADAPGRVARALVMEVAGADGAPLPRIAARDVLPGMLMLDADGAHDVVTSVERVPLDRPVHDLDVEGTHNFVAGGLCTHNSIYSFRGADVTNILNFATDNPDAKVVKLEQNYRSTQNILNAANGVIRHNREQMEKDLWTDLGEGDLVKVRELEDEHAEARYVVGEIERLVDEGVSRQEIACFYRTNAQSRVLEDTLVRRDVGYQVVGGTKFYERAEVKDAVAYLTVLGNPQDVISFTRIANSPRRGIGQTSLSRVISHAATMGISVWDAAADPASVPGLGTAAIRSFERFMTTMTELRAQLEQRVPVGDLVEAVLNESGYLDWLEAERTIEAQGRTENLQELIEVAREFDAAADAENDTLDVFLQGIALVADADTRRDDDGLVTLMTLHNAKGLEYPIVFILGCEEGVFPHSRSVDEGTLEEERRLMYVGITRAMRSLTLTHARRRAVFGGAPNFG